MYRVLDYGFVFVGRVLNGTDALCRVVWMSLYVLYLLVYVQRWAVFNLANLLELAGVVRLCLCLSLPVLSNLTRME